MGNRAVITHEPYNEDAVGIYLHWNGGRASIEGFLRAAKTLNFRSSDPQYAMAYLTGIITQFFGDGLSCGIGRLKELDCDNGDNGTYVIKNWEIVGRMFHSSDDSEEINEEKTTAICEQIVTQWPKSKVANKVSN